MGWFARKSLKQQIVLVMLVILIGPLLALGYTFWREQKGADEYYRYNVEALQGLLQEGSTGLEALLEGDYGTPDQLLNSYYPEAEKLLRTNPGVTLGIYLQQKDLTLEYGSAFPGRGGNLNRRIFQGRGPLLTLLPDKQNRHWDRPNPILVSELLTAPSGTEAVIWAMELPLQFYRSHQSSRVFTLILTIPGILLGLIGIFLLLGNQLHGINILKKGVAALEKDLSQGIPSINGELGDIGEALNKMAHSLKEKEYLEEQLRRSERLAALGHIVAGVAHELRNPLGIARGTVQLLEQELADRPQLNEHLQILKEQIDRQNNLVNELLDFARPQKPQYEPLKVAQLLHSALLLTEAYALKHHVNIELQSTEELPLFWGDGERLKQVFVNLILNAVEAMPEGGNLRIGILPAQEHLEISFRDSGKGINAGDLENIFNPFYTTRKGGTGLGLAISHRLVEMHGGKIEVSSQPGRGSCFKVILPFGSNPAERGGDFD